MDSLKSKLVFEKYNSLKNLRQGSPAPKEKKISKWTIGLKLSLIVGAAAYILARYKPYDVTLEGDVHYYVLSKESVAELKLSGKELSDLEMGIMKLIEELPLTALGATPSSLLGDICSDTISGLSSDLNQVKSLVSQGYSLFADYFSNTFAPTIPDK